MTKQEIKDKIIDIPCLLFNKQEWLSNRLFNFTEEEIDGANEKGLIGIRNGVACYVSKFIRANI